MEGIRDHYHAWLRDAHAMEEQALTMMRGMTWRLEEYPALRSRLETHIGETQRQAADLRALLETRATSTSMVKDALGKLTATGQALSGLFASDEVVKGAMAGYTFEHMEIAAYRVLISAAAMAGDQAAISIFERNLNEEIAMAEWLREHLDETVRAFLAREEADL